MVELVAWESEPSVPLITIVYVPAAVAVQDIVAVPEPVKLEGVSAPQANPAGDEPVSETVPAKWFNDVTPTVEVAETPTSIETGDEMETVKSPNARTTVAAWTSGALVLVNGDVSLPATAALHTTVAGPQPPV